VFPNTLLTKRSKLKCNTIDYDSHTILYAVHGKLESTIPDKGQKGLFVRERSDKKPARVLL